MIRGEDRVGVPGPRVGVVTPLAPLRVGVTRPGVPSPGPCCTGVVRPLPPPPRRPPSETAPIPPVTPRPPIRNSAPRALHL